MCPSRRSSTHPDRQGARPLASSLKALALALAASALVGCGDGEKTEASFDDDPASDERAADAGRARDGGRDAGREDASKPSAEPDASGPEGEGDTCAAIRQDAPAVRGPIDVVWVIDTSLSMIDEAEKIATNLPRFLTKVQTSGADIRLVMLTGTDPAFGTPLAADQVRYRWLPALVDSKALYTVTLGRLGQYESFLRPTAPTHFVMVTDDDDRFGADLFVQEMQKGLGHPITVHAITSESVNGRPCANPACGGIPIPLLCGAASVGTAYLEAAEQTKGETLSICTDDWTDVFARLESAVIAAAPLPCEYALADASGGDVDPQKVQVVYTPEGGKDDELPRAKDAASCGAKRAWHYDDAASPETIVLCPEACKTVQQGGAMDIAFGCTPVLVL